jgi:archaellum biogenesis ATPase FlaH
MVVSIKADIEKNDIIVFTIPNKNYTDNTLKIVSALSSIHKKICYVSLNRPYNTIIKNFQDIKIDVKKFLFIDCVTQKREEHPSVVCVSSPRALTELNIAISKVLSTKVDSTVFDSLSTLLIYEQSSTVIKFAHSVITMFRNAGSKGIFTCLKEDINSELIKDLSMFADKIVELS